MITNHQKNEIHSLKNTNKYVKIKNTENIYYLNYEIINNTEITGGILYEIGDDIETIIVDPAGVMFNSNKFIGGGSSGALYNAFKIINKDHNHNYNVDYPNTYYNTYNENYEINKYYINDKKHEKQNDIDKFNSNKYNKVIALIHIMSPDASLDNEKNPSTGESWFYIFIKRELNNIKNNIKLNFVNFSGILRLPLISLGINGRDIDKNDYMPKYINYIIKIFKDVNYCVVICSFYEKNKNTNELVILKDTISKLTI